jgi:hypothetical protein
VPFAAVIAGIQKGVVADRLSEALADVAAAVYAAGKLGTLTLTVKIEPAVKGGSEDGSITMTAVISTKLPKDDTSGIFYTTEDGTISRNDPRQPVLTGLHVARAAGDSA